MPKSKELIKIKRVVGHDYQGTAEYKYFYGHSKKECLQKYHDFLLKKEEKDKERKNMPFEKWVDTWLYTYKQPDVKSTSFSSSYQLPCEKFILPYFKGYTIQEITQADIKKFLNSLKDKSQSFIDKIIICLNGIFESALDNDLILKNPVRNLKMKSAQEKEKKRTFDKASRDYLCSVEHKYALYVRILLLLGLRSSELCGLKWSNIDFKNKTVSITQSITSSSSERIIGKPKSDNSTRVLPAPDLLIEELQKVQRNGEFVAQSNGQPFYPKRIYNYLKIFYNYLKVPQEKRLSPHELRHTCGTLLYQDTKDVYFVSRFLGHSDISITTKTYVHSTLQDTEIHLDF